MHRSGAPHRSGIIVKFEQTSHHALRWVGRFVESQKRLETKVGLRTNLWYGKSDCYGNRALVWCLACIDYEMLELDSDDLVMLWDPDFVRGARLLHYMFILNSGVEVALICLDALRLPSYARTPHVGSSISGVKDGQSLVPRGTQIPYSSAVDLMAWLEIYRQHN
ncbi:hypothetical protein M9H77_04407 [Catharanthus roseus]|uniref:Uncharacterized protein n=1 Tax=Catharanthus roseus TaxID=4058 RepID=A0ACC0CE05_CATRO|nr:hypothetical protein M9H77_04407 [Catharanthus roseus]